ncbi:hypothetical protein PPS11_02291 [Pseudomonas putida S11]|nr:hypothetical protein PPS11_02291 [Pseudomonas putida S11]
MRCKGQPISARIDAALCADSVDACPRKGRVLFYCDTIMQHSRCKQHFQVAAFYALYPLRVDPYAMDVGQVVGAIWLVSR